MIKDNLLAVRQTLKDNVKLVAVSKYQPLDYVKQAYEAGQRVFGESHALEVRDKAEAMPKDIEWHFIGHLQTNKVKYIAPFISCIESVDSLKLMQEINKQALKNDRVIDCLLQFHVAQEETKSGFTLEECEQVLSSEEFSNLKNIRIVGVMGMATYTEDEKQIVLEELNVKAMTSAVDADKYISYKLKPQLKTLGPKYGKKLGVISQFLAKCNAKEVVNAVKDGGVYEIVGEDVYLKQEDLQIFTESANGYVASADKGLTVALNTELSEELIAEGIERELVSKIQNMRKEAGFEVTDRIEIYYLAEGKAKQVLSKGNFAGDVLANCIVEGSAEGFVKEQNINGEKVVLTLIRK